MEIQYNKRYLLDDLELQLKRKTKMFIHLTL